MGCGIFREKNSMREWGKKLEGITTPREPRLLQQEYTSSSWRPTICMINVHYYVYISPLEAFLSLGPTTVLSIISKVFICLSETAASLVSESPQSLASRPNASTLNYPRLEDREQSRWRRKVWSKPREPAPTSFVERTYSGLRYLGHHRDSLLLSCGHRTLCGRAIGMQAVGVAYVSSVCCILLSAGGNCGAEHLA